MFAVSFALNGLFQSTGWPGTVKAMTPDDLRAMLVVLLTAKAQESDVRRGFDAGADAYVKKPFSPADLSARVRELLGAGG